jgi:hypothetical protein
MESGERATGAMENRMSESSSANGPSPNPGIPSLLLQGTGVALAVIFGWLMVYVFEGARLGIFDVPFTVVTVNGTTLIRCLVSLAGIFILLGWSLIPGLLLLWLLGVRLPLRHFMTAILAVLLVLAFTGIMVRFFAYVFMASGAALAIALAKNAVRWRWGRRDTGVPSKSETVARSVDQPLEESRLEKGFEMLGIGLRGVAILLLACFVAGRDAALHQARYLVRYGADRTVTACMADQADKFLCLESPGSPRPILLFVAKTAADAQGFTVERVGPFIRPFGIWDTPRGRPAWNWARRELQQE